jgi:hypothetical protein
VRVIETDIGAFIVNANPVCNDADRQPNGYYKLLGGRVGCGKQVRLHSWTCTTTGEEGWRPEIVELEPCE